MWKRTIGMGFEQRGSDRRIRVDPPLAREHRNRITCEEARRVDLGLRVLGRKRRRRIVICELPRAAALR